MSETLWGQPDDEVIQGADRNDGIRRALEEIGEQSGDELPAHIEIQEYERMAVTLSGVYTLERLLESLDEEDGNPDGPTEPTPAMVVAEAAFHAAVLAEYKSWNVESVPGTLERVDVREWIQEHDPGWLQRVTVLEACEA